MVLRVTLFKVHRAIDKTIGFRKVQKKITAGFFPESGPSVVTGSGRG